MVRESAREIEERGREGVKERFATVARGQLSRVLLEPSTITPLKRRPNVSGLLGAWSTPTLNWSDLIMVASTLYNKHQTKQRAPAHTSILQSKWMLTAFSGVRKLLLTICSSFKHDTIPGVSVNCTFKPTVPQVVKICNNISIHTVS